MPGEGAEQTVSMTTQPESEAQLDAAARACAAAGARLTPLRRSVLALILGAETPLTAYQLLDRLRARNSSIAWRA
jgi:Fur family zinc uptake transcriptional regulator